MTVFSTLILGLRKAGATWRERLTVVEDKVIALENGSGGDLLAANNLSDVASAATARANLATNKIFLSFEGISSKAADAEVMRWVAPFACTLVNFHTALNGALATADSTVQAKVAGSNAGSTSTGLATQTQSGSAAGNVSSATPLTTNLALTAGQILSFTVGGGSTATGTMNLSALLTY